jgi:VWFA-related protein
VLVLTAAASVATGQEPPRFQSSVELTSIDAAVLDGDGNPIRDLTPDHFTVRVDGRPRRVVKAEWVALTTSPADTPLPPPPDGYSTNASATGGRLIVIAIDQPNIPFGETLTVQRSVNEFIDRLQPTDRVAIVGFGLAPVSTPFLGDHERLKQAVAKVSGQKRDLSGATEHDMAISEALQIDRGDRMLTDMVIRRSCSFRSADPSEFELCATEVVRDARTLAMDTRLESRYTMDGLRDLFGGLRTFDGPKTLLLLTQGAPDEDQQVAIPGLGALAEASRTNVYVLRLDRNLIDIERQLKPTAPIEDRRLVDQGLNMLAGATRGSLFPVYADPSGVFRRIEAELTGYYLLGIESAPSDSDGKPHPINVTVSQPGASVRVRRQLMAVTEAAPPRTAREAVVAGLKSPLMISALPISIATFSLQGPEESNVQLLIHADIGTGYSSATPVSLAYMFVDSAGRVVESQVINSRLPPVMNGVPSALQFTGGASLPPGEYTLKLAAAEGDVVGTVEHRVRATLVDGGAVKLSELTAGGPVNAEPPVRPTVGHTVTFGLLHAYLEAYGSAAKSLQVRYEVAPDADGPAILTADTPTQTAGDTRAIFTQVIPVRQLPPGKYLLRAVVSSPDAPERIVTRGFDVATPAVLMTSAENPSAVTVPDELFLPVDDALLARPFVRAEATRTETVRVFRERVAPAAARSFDRGVASLDSGDYSTAEASFKEVLKTDGDATAPLTYLAATFAASGHDAEAAGAWQTALIEGEDLPEIYLWLGDALLRTHDLPQARTILEEAAAKFPSDIRFTKPLALVYATFGRGRDAVRALARYLEAHRDDRDALFHGVEWIYHLRSANAVAQTPADDLRLARAYADAYEKAKGPQVALVKQWLQAIEQRQ